MSKDTKDRIIHVQWDKLKLDNQKNPRLPERLQNKSDSDIIQYMINDGNILELMNSIGEKGFFQGEPVLALDNEDGTYTVVEGNRRITAVMLLHNPSLDVVGRESIKKASETAREKPATVPTLIYYSRDEILDYIGYRHITGIKEWNSLEKARYLKELYDRSDNNADQICQELAKIIGSRSDYVRKLLCGLAVYRKIQEENYFGIVNLENDIKFSLLTTALGYRNLQSFMGLSSGEDININSLNINNLRKFTQWVFDKSTGKTILGESRNLSMLADVVNDAESLKILEEEKDIEAAFLMSAGVVPMIEKAIDNAHNSLKMAHKYALADTVLEESTIRKLEKIYTLSKTIQLAVKKTEDD